MNILQPSIRIIIILLSLVYSGCSSDDEPLKDALDQGQMTHSLQEADGYTAPEGNLIINNDNVSTNLTSVQVSLKAQDAVSVDRYFLSDNASTPTVNSSGWISIGSGGEWSHDTTYSLSTIEGSQNLYVWYLDRTNNISDQGSDSIIYDITAPSSASVRLASGSGSTKNPANLTLNALDSVGVISYYLSENSSTPTLETTGWSEVNAVTTFTETTSFTLSSGKGTKTVYAWFRDFAGNISIPANTSFDLTENIDFDDGILPSVFSMSGSNSWFISSNTSYSGNYSLRSGNIGDSQSSCVSLSQSTGSGTFSFYYKVSSESNFDYFRFYINGSSTISISGFKNWAQYSRTMNSGTNTFKWCYSKDSSYSTGSDAAWIDSIVLP